MAVRLIPLLPSQPSRFCGPDPVRPALRVLEHGPGLVPAVHDRGGAPADEHGHAGQFGGRVAEHLLDQGLRRLLARLGRDVAGRRPQAEGVREAGDLVAEQAGAEDDVLGVLHRQRRGGAQPPAIPQRRRCSIVRTLVVFARARRGSSDVRGSTTSTSTPRRPSSIAADSPLGPPPTISTGTRSGTAVIGTPVMGWAGRRWGRGPHGPESAPPQDRRPGSPRRSPLPLSGSASRGVPRGGQRGFRSCHWRTQARP
jgi:hypothetical protein